MQPYHIEEAIAWRVAAVEANESQIGVFSTGEQIAVALVLNRPDLFPHGGYTILEAVDRLGPEWTKAALAVQKAGEDRAVIYPKREARKA